MALALIPRNPSNLPPAIRKKNGKRRSRLGVALGNGKSSTNNSLNVERHTQSMIARMLNAHDKTLIENKVAYINGTLSAVDWTGTIVTVTTNLIRGDGAINAFTGSLIRPTSLRLRWAIDSTSAGITETQSVRAIVFQWADASVPSPIGILQTNGTADSYLSSYEWTNIRKIFPKYDHTGVLRVYDSSAQLVEPFDTGYLSNWKTVQFNATSTSQQMNGLYILFVSNLGVLSTLPDVHYYVELVFSDA